MATTANSFNANRLPKRKRGTLPLGANLLTFVLIYCDILFNAVIFPRIIFGSFITWDFY